MKDISTEVYAFIANVNPIRPRYQALDFILWAIAE
jgi:hypothetical protein